jgi:hypothetical protein
VDQDSDGAGWLFLFVYDTVPREEPLGADHVHLRRARTLKGNSRRIG